MKALMGTLFCALIMVGCATKKFVGAEIEASETRTQSQVEDLKRIVEETQTEIRNLAEELDLKLDGIEDNTRELSGKTEENRQLIAKMGHLSFKKTLSDADAFFKSDSAELNDSAKEELDKFGQLIKAQNKMLHLEIQGHTDNRGSDSYNRKLGLKRAEEVRDFLYKNHDIPLHLMNVISMGSEHPVVDNDTRENRAQNRRVDLIVRLRL